MLVRSLLIASLGLLLLVLFLLFLPPLPVAVPADLSLLIANQKLSVSGSVASERPFSSEKRLLLSNNIEVRCSCPRLPPLKNKNVSIIGSLQRYQNKTWVQAHEVRVQP